jgi:hypothetical protein
MGKKNSWLVGRGRRGGGRRRRGFAKQITSDPKPGILK